jgi:hypothetical protein
MKLISLFAAILFSAQLMAEEVKMAVITSEFDQDVTDYYLDLNENNEITSMRYITVMPNGGIYEDISIPAEKVINEGAVIVERDGRQVVRLKVENFNVSQGGTIHLSYLYNGVSGTRQTKTLVLERVGDRFVLKDSSKEINRMHLKANRVRLIGVVGVREIQTFYSEKSL